MKKVLVEVISSDRYLGSGIKLCEGYLIQGKTNSAVDRIVLLPRDKFGTCWIGLYLTEEHRWFKEAQYYCSNLCPLESKGANACIDESIMDLLKPYLSESSQIKEEFLDLKLVKIFQR